MKHSNVDDRQMIGSWTEFLSQKCSIKLKKDISEQQQQQQQII